MAYRRGHVQGTKRTTRRSQSWYDQIAEAHIQRIEQEQTPQAAATAAHLKTMAAARAHQAALIAQINARLAQIDAFVSLMTPAPRTV